jgi:hypothetical protein
MFIPRYDSDGAAWGIRRKVSDSGVNANGIPLGRKALEAMKVKVNELFGERNETK